MSRLKAEYCALTYLEPCAKQMGIPCVLDWEETSDNCTLVQTGVPGKHHPAAVPLSASDAVLNRSFGGAVAWIDRFQRTVPCLTPTSLQTLAAGYADEMEDRAEVAEVAGPLIAILRSPGSAAQRSGVPIHGDFYHRNVLFDGPKISVVDWATLGTGFPLQDNFFYLVNSHFFIDGPHIAQLQNHHHVFFSASSACRFSVRMIRAAGWSQEEARFLFYCYLATQICLDSREFPLKACLDLVKYLDYHGYPAVGTVLPPPEAQ